MTYPSDTGNLLSFIAVVLAFTAFLMGVIGTRIKIFVILAIIVMLLAMVCFFGTIIADEMGSKGRKIEK